MFPILLSFILLFIAAPHAHAAILYLDPPESTHNLGDTFIQEINLDTEGEYINAVEAHIEYPQDVLEVRDFSKGNSILSLWPEEPVYENGELSFVGGVPAGYIGEDGVLGKIIFYVKQVSSDIVAEVKYVEGSKALLNDGAGSQAGLTTKGASYSISSKPADERSDEWAAEVAADNIPPEAFHVVLSNAPDVYDGNYFIIFSTVDKQTGVDHYEVLEYIKGKSVKNKDARSPYLLDNQKLGGIIRVRAVDKAGNAAVAELRMGEAGEERFPWAWVILGIFGLIVVGVGYWFYKKRI